MSSDEDLAYLGVAQAQALFRARKLSPVELVEALIRRTEALDPLIHAFVTTTPELALVRAREAEQRFMRGDADAFTGIPYGLKDIIETAGVLTTGQSRILEHHVPQHDAELERRIKAAGGGPHHLRFLLTRHDRRTRQIRRYTHARHQLGEMVRTVPERADRGGVAARVCRGRLVRTLRPGWHEELTERINRDIHKVVGSADMKELMQANGQSAALSTPVAFTEFLRVDSARTSDYIKQAGIKPQ